ncbi:MAG TPA: hypothetical protein VNZ06_09055 [Steroidobacteraceae bacterium]|jgi:hypothetical protein|nr:hypothetical protein [Steroidobacteraceae bacterium]
MRRAAWGKLEDFKMRVTLWVALAGLSLSSASFGSPDVNSTIGYPRTMVQAISGAQCNISSANYTLAARYDIVMLGCNWENQGVNIGNVVNGIHAASNGTMVSPVHLVGRYSILEVPSGANLSASANEDRQVQTAGWYLCPLGTSCNNATAVNDSDGHMALVNFSTYAPSYSGQTPYQWFASYVWNTYGLGKGGPVNGANANNAAPNVDFFYFDNTLPTAKFSGDWLRNGTLPGTLANTPLALDTAIQNAQLQLCPALHSASGNKLCFVNQALGWTDSLGVNYASGVGAFDGAMQQFIWGTGLSNAVETWGGFTYAMNEYKSQVAGGAPYVMVTGPVANSTAADYQYFRYAFGMCTMDIGYCTFGLTSYYPSADSIDGSNTTTWPWFDEEQGGTLKNVKWLGLPANPNNVSNSCGVPVSNTWTNGNTCAWKNGVYRRDFQNGIILVLPRQTTGGAAVTVTTEVSYCHLQNSNDTVDASVNNGSCGTSFTLNPSAITSTGDALFLSRTPVNSIKPNPPSNISASPH